MSPVFPCGEWCELQHFSSQRRLYLPNGPAFLTQQAGLFRVGGGGKCYKYPGVAGRTARIFFWRLLISSFWRKNFSVASDSSLTLQQEASGRKRHPILAQIGFSLPTSRTTLKVCSCNSSPLSASRYCTAANVPVWDCRQRPAGAACESAAVVAALAPRIAN